jgi:hypothetical protein
LKHFVPFETEGSESSSTFALLVDGQACSSHFISSADQSHSTCETLAMLYTSKIFYEVLEKQSSFQI